MHAWSCIIVHIRNSKDLCKSQAATTVKPTTQATTDDNLDNFDISGSGSDPDNSNNYYDQPTSGSNSADFNAFQTYLSILGNMNRYLNGFYSYILSLLYYVQIEHLKSVYSASFLKDFIMYTIYT